MTTKAERQELLRIAELVLSGAFSAGTIYVLKDDMQTLARYAKAQLSLPQATGGEVGEIRKQEPSSGEKEQDETA